MEYVLVVLLILVVGLAYMAPTLIAAKRCHRNLGSIAVINILLGWSLLGWVIALAWSFSANVEPTAQ